MKALYALCLSLAAFAFARPAQAELEYLVYDLSTKTTETVTNPDVTSDEYHTGSKMLFVRDTTVEDQDKPYYIGVFEVTQAQAKQLNWTGASEGGGWAYGTDKESNFVDRSLPANVAFPTHGQWVAYTDDPATLSNDAKGDINISGGVLSRQTLEAWYKSYLCASPSKLKSNSHGVYDIYGNVAEYATDGEGTGPFYGGASAQADRIGQLADTSNDKLRLQGKASSRYGTANVCGARLVYMPPKEQLYSVSVSLDNADVTETTVTVPKGMDPAALAVGTSVTVTPPTPDAGKRLSGYTVTPDTLDFTEASNGTLTFTMPTSAVTIAYTSEPYGTITVKNARMRVNEGEWGTTAQVVVGDTVTLDADEPGQYQFFSRWDGAQLDENTATLSVTEALMGKETTIEAVYQYYPRVIVVGGTATVAEADAENSFGNGYYAMDTVLTLEAETLSGYKFSGWTVDKADMADALDTERGTYTIGANDAGTTVTLTATYEYDESGESGTVTPADIHLGSTLDEGVYTAHPLFGWTPRTMETTVTDETSNRYHVYPYVAAGLYANLDLTTGKVVYSDSLSQGETSGGSSMPSPPQLWQFDGDIEAYEAAFEAWKKEWDEWAETHGSGTFNAKQLPLRRVIPTDGATEFYLGVYETAMGHVENLKALREGKDPSSSDAAAYCGKNFGGAERVRYPTQNDLLRVAQTSVTTENPGAGEGYPTDKNLTEAMVVGGNTQSKPGNVNVMTPCYGFYGLWGNGWETDKDGNGFAGSAYFALNNGQNPFLTSKVVQLKEIPGQYSFATFRPAIDVEEAVVIYVGKESSATAVQVAPGQDLFADPSVLPTKALSRCTGWTLGDTKIKAGENHTVTTEDDGKVLVPTWEETPVSIPVKCENCLGPATVYPGQIVTVYPLEGMAFAAEAPLTSSNSDVEVGTPAADGTITVTFPNTLPLDSEIMLTGKLVPIEEPEPEPEVKPGYRFRLR